MTLKSGTWLVTGASRGFGREIVLELLQRGAKVAATARDPEAARRSLAIPSSEGHRLIVLPLDVCSPDSVTRAIDATVSSFGGLDGLVNNAGYGLLGAVEEAAPDEVSDLFAVNVFGAHRLMCEALPFIRRSEAGRIVSISSIGGFTASSGWGIYNASKFALEGLSEALALDMANTSVRVTIVEPGSFRTEFLSSRSLRHTRKRFDHYALTAGKTRSSVVDRGGRQAGDPIAAARVIIEAVLQDEPPLRLPLGRDAIARVEAKLKAVQHDVDVWRAAATATAFANDV